MCKEVCFSVWASESVTKDMTSVVPLILHDELLVGWGGLYFLCRV